MRVVYNRGDVIRAHSATHVEPVILPNCDPKRLERDSPLQYVNAPSDEGIKHLSFPRKSYTRIKELFKNESEPLILINSATSVLEGPRVRCDSPGSSDLQLSPEKLAAESSDLNLRIASINRNIHLIKKMRRGVAASRQTRLLTMQRLELPN